MVVRRDDAARPLAIDKTLDLRPEREAQRGANCAGREARTRAVSRGVTPCSLLARLARTAFVNVLWSEDERTALGLGTELYLVRSDAPLGPILLAISVTNHRASLPAALPDAACVRARVESDSCLAGGRGERGVADASSAHKTRVGARTFDECAERKAQRRKRVHRRLRIKSSTILRGSRLCCREFSTHALRTGDSVSCSLLCGLALGRIAEGSPREAHAQQPVHRRSHTRTRRHAATRAHERAQHRPRGLSMGDTTPGRALERAVTV